MSINCSIQCMTKCQDLSAVQSYNQSGQRCQSCTFYKYYCNIQTIRKSKVKKNGCGWGEFSWHGEIVLWMRPSQNVLTSQKRRYKLCLRDVFNLRLLWTLIREGYRLRDWEQIGEHEYELFYVDGQYTVENNLY